MNKRKLLLIAGGACLLIVAGIFTAKWQFESKMRKDIETFLATLPAPLAATAGKIDVSLFDKSATLTNISGGSGEITFSIDRVEATGINEDAFKENAGVAQFVKTLKYTGLRYSSPAGNGQIESDIHENISGDYTLLRNEITKALPALMEAAAVSDGVLDSESERRLMLALSGLLKASESMTIGKVQTRNYTSTSIMDGQKVTISIAAASSENYSLREMGPLSYSGITVAVDDAQIASMDSLFCDGITLPSLVEMLKVLGTTKNPTPELLSPTLQGQDFALRNLHGKNIVVRDPKAADRTMLSIEDMAVSYVAETAHTVDFTYSGLNIDKKIIEEEGGLPEEALALLPDVLTFSGAFRSTATLKDLRTSDLDCREISLKEATLGEFSLNVAVNDLSPMAVLLRNPGPAALKRWGFSATDTGASEFMFTVAAAEVNEEAEDSGETKKTTPADVRATIVADLALQRDAQPNEMLKNLVGAFVTFMEKPGSTLKVAVAPETPLNLIELQTAAFMDPEKLGLTVSVTEAK